MNSNNQAQNRKVIDITKADDDEVVIIPSYVLSDIACDALTALESLNDISHLLYMIFNGDLKQHQLESLSRFAYETSNSRADAQLDIIRTLNEALKQSKFGAMEGV